MIFKFQSYLEQPLVLILALLLVAAPSMAQKETDQLTINSATYQFGGEELGAARKQGQMAQIFQLQKDLVYQILGQAGIDPQKLDPGVKAQLDRFYTTDLLAFEYFCQCLDLMDQGLFVEAEDSCNKAVERDPNFAMAKSLRDSMPRDLTEVKEVAQFVTLQAKSDEEISAVEFAAFTQLAGPADAGAAEAAQTANPPEAQLASNVDRVDQQVSDTTNVIVETGENNTLSSQPPTGSNPVCDGGTCGYYSTFLSRQAEGSDEIQQGSRPFIALNAVDLDNNPVVTVAQQGANGFLQAQDLSADQAQLTAFRDGEFGQGNDNINVTLDRVVSNTLLDGELVLGQYQTGVDFTGSFEDSTGSHTYDFFHGWAYFAEGTATPQATVANFIANNQSFEYSGVVGGDFSVDGNLTFCVECGRFTGTLNYGSQQVNNFLLEIDTGGAAARINANGVALSDQGDFSFNQSQAQFSVGTNLNNVSAASEGSLAGRNFGANAEAVGGVYSVAGQSEGSTIRGAGNFGGVRE
jgi:hypothetical protein